MRFVIINELSGICENIIKWDGVALWVPPEGRVAQQSDEINIGDQCELINGTWNKIS